MKTKLNSAWRYTSWLLLLLVLTLMVIGWNTNPGDPHRQYLTLSNNFRIAILNRGLDARIAFFNSETGPYAGSIVALRGEHENVPHAIRRQLAFGDTCGIYYRYFAWPDHVLWTLAVSLWYPVALFSLLPTYDALRRRSRAR